jgi:hypothetical protein
VNQLTHPSSVKAAVARWCGVLFILEQEARRFTRPVFVRHEGREAHLLRTAMF